MPNEMARRVVDGRDLRPNSPVRCGAVHLDRQLARYMGTDNMHPAGVPRVKLRRQDWDDCG